MQAALIFERMILAKFAFCSCKIFNGKYLFLLFHTRGGDQMGSRTLLLPEKILDFSQK